MINSVHVDVAVLETIDFARLVARDAGEVAKLLACCQMPGFFYLDLQGDTTGQILADLESVLQMTRKYFDHPQGEKMKEFRPTEDRGYKPGEDESFEIARDEIVSKTLVLPDMLQKQMALLERFIEQCHYVTHTMLSRLSDALQPDEKSMFEVAHREGGLSNSGLKLVYEPTQARLADVVENKHTDSGTLTLLFGDQWGLQIEMPDTKEWKFVEPRARYAVINVADSLELLSKGRLHSCLHRVTQATDGFEKRYYVVYFVRPGHGVKIGTKV